MRRRPWARSVYKLVDVCQPMILREQHSASDDEIVPATKAARRRDATSTTYKLIEVTGGHYAHAGFGREDWLNVLA